MGKHDKIQISEEDGYTRVVLPDAIGMDEGKTIGEKVINIFTAKNQQILLDFSNTTTLYSSGIGLLIRLQKVAQESKRALYIVNISRKLRDLLASFNLDKVFQIYATDVEFEVLKEDLWQKKLSSISNEFIFVEMIENRMYRLSLSGQMSSLHDLSAVSEFKPQENVEYLIINLENLELMDTYGAQLFNDFIDRMRNKGKKCIIYGADPVARNLFSLLPSVSEFIVYDTEKQALESIDS